MYYYQRIRDLREDEDLLQKQVCGIVDFAGLHRGAHPQQKGAEPLRTARKGDRADKQIPLVVGRAERQDIRAFGRAF